MRIDEQSATTLDPLGGFLISSSRPRFVSPPAGLEEFLAPSPIPDDPRPAGNDRGEASIGAAPPFNGLVGESYQYARQPPPMEDDRGAIAALVARFPRVEAGDSERSPPPRALTAEAAALAAAESQALVAPADVLGEFARWTREADDRRDEQAAALLGDLLAGGGLVDPSPWFPVGSESASPRDLADGFASDGFQSFGSPAVASPPNLDRVRLDVGPYRASASSPSVDRLGESSSEAFEEIEARLSLVAARLEGAIERIESTTSSPLGSRAGGFRGRVDE